MNDYQEAQLLPVCDTCFQEKCVCKLMQDEQKNTDQLLKAIEKLNSVPEPEHKYCYFAGQEWVAKEVHEKEIAQARKDEQEQGFISGDDVQETLAILKEFIAERKKLAQLEKEDSIK